MLVVFLLVCLLEAVAGVLLWGGHKSGAVLALVLLPLGEVLWWGLPCLSRRFWPWFGQFRFS
ncbi:MAG: hypothetical protein SFU83_08835 [Meiothermus sp.]|nr:hypothetical protein [Meiothermus sp.]